MHEILRNALGPALALIGTIVVALLGYRQWKKQQDLARYGGFLAERQAAYKDLWEKLEAVHLSVRSQSFREKEFHELVRAANVHMIKAGLHLDRGEKKRVNDYLAALGNLGRLLEQSAATDAKSQAQRTLHDTAALPLEIQLRIEGLRGAYTAVEEQRESLIAHFRKVLGADLFQ